MFIDLEMVDKWFEIGYQDGCLIQFNVFNKRVLLSLEQVAGTVSMALGETFTLDDLTQIAARGWIPLLHSDDCPDLEIGLPLYAPPRIQWLLTLERDGYSAEELCMLASYQEWVIDNLLTTDELAYRDDDLELLILHTEDMLLSETYRSNNGTGDAPAHETYARQLHVLRRFQREGIPEPSHYWITKYAFRVRAANEVFRIQFIEMDQAKIRAGYSPFVVCFGDTWHFADETIIFTATGVDWNATITSALAHTVNEVPLVRVPGFLLCGDKVVSTQTLTPKEYESLWKQHDVDRYRMVWADMQGQKRCLHCFAHLPHTPSCRRMYCDEKCRNASKQKRYRQRHPNAVREAQRKYWSQFDLDEGV